MFQRISIALFTALLSFFAAPLLSVIPASAAPMAQTIVITSDDGQDDKDDKDDKDEDEDDDDDDKDDDDWKPGKSVVVPPTVVTEEDLESDDSSNVAPMQITTDGSNAKTPADTVYNVVKAVFENFEEFKKLHPALANLKPESMIKDGLSAPLHEGAVKYYKEKGWIK